MAVLAVVYVVLAIWDDDLGGRIPTVLIVSLAVILLAEFVARCWDAPSRWYYARSHWMDLVSSLPVISGLRVLRLLRLLRLVAGLRLLSVIQEQFGRSKGRQSLWFLFPALIVLWVAAAYAMWLVEHGHNPAVRTLTDALYWAIITTTTIGYGDVSPTTPEGRIIAGLLAFLGIGLFGFVSAQLTARLLGQRDEVAGEIAALRKEIADLREALVRDRPSAALPDAEPGRVTGRQRRRT